MPRTRTLAASYDQFWGLLKEREGKQAGTRARIDVLLLGREYGAARVRRAVEEALELGGSNVGSIGYLWNVNNLEQRPTAKPVDIGALSRYDRPQPSLEEYERLRPNWLAREVIQGTPPSRSCRRRSSSMPNNCDCPGWAISLRAWPKKR